MIATVLPTEQTFCADVDGNRIECVGSGQDGERNHGDEATRFTADEATALDVATGLTWLRDANAPGFPLAWDEAAAFIETMNRDATVGFDDWRLPTRRELFSLISFDVHSPALPHGHPFRNVFNGWYRTATPSAMHPRQMWRVHLGGGRMFWGDRAGYDLVWPVRGTSTLPAATPGDNPYGATWPDERFHADDETATDRLTGIVWSRSADLAHGPVEWSRAFEIIRRVNETRLGGLSSWRLPDIREFESLVDASRHSPALPHKHPFLETQEAYWTSTNSAFKRDWAMCGYLHKGAAGVGFKRDRGFHVWAVADSTSEKKNQP